MSIFTSTITPTANIPSGYTLDDSSSSFFKRVDALEEVTQIHPIWYNKHPGDKYNTLDELNDEIELSKTRSPIRLDSKHGLLREMAEIIEKQRVVSEYKWPIKYTPWRLILLLFGLYRLLIQLFRIPVIITLFCLLPFLTPQEYSFPLVILPLYIFTFYHLYILLWEDEVFSRFLGWTSDVKSGTYSHLLDTSSQRILSNPNLKNILNEKSTHPFLWWNGDFQTLLPVLVNDFIDFKIPYIRRYVRNNNDPTESIAIDIAFPSRPIGSGKKVGQEEEIQQQQENQISTHFSTQKQQNSHFSTQKPQQQQQQQQQSHHNNHTVRLSRPATAQTTTTTTQLSRTSGQGHDPGLISSISSNQQHSHSQHPSQHSISSIKQPKQVKISTPNSISSLKQHQQDNKDQEAIPEIDVLFNTSTNTDTNSQNTGLDSQNTGLDSHTRPNYTPLTQITYLSANFTHQQQQQQEQQQQYDQLEQTPSIQNTHSSSSSSIDSTSPKSSTTSPKSSNTSPKSTNTSNPTTSSSPSSTKNTSNIIKTPNDTNTPLDAHHNGPNNVNTTLEPHNDLDTDPNTPQELYHDPTKPILILIHGLNGSSQASHVQSQVDYYRKRGHTCIAMNSRGFGGSFVIKSLFVSSRTSDLETCIKFVHVGAGNNTIYDLEQRTRKNKHGMKENGETQLMNFNNCFINGISPMDIENAMKKPLLSPFSNQNGQIGQYNQNYQNNCQNNQNQGQNGGSRTTTTSSTDRYYVNGGIGGTGGDRPYSSQQQQQQNQTSSLSSHQNHHNNNTSTPHTPHQIITTPLMAVGFSLGGIMLSVYCTKMGKMSGLTSAFAISAFGQRLNNKSQSERDWDPILMDTLKDFVTKSEPLLYASQPGLDHNNQNSHFYPSNHGVSQNNSNGQYHNQSGDRNGGSNGQYLNGRGGSSNEQYQENFTKFIDTYGILNSTSIRIFDEYYSRRVHGVNTVEKFSDQLSFARERRLDNLHTKLFILHPENDPILSIDSLYPAVQSLLPEDEQNLSFKKIKNNFYTKPVKNLIIHCPKNGGHVGSYRNWNDKWSYINELSYQFNITAVDDVLRQQKGEFLDEKEEEKIIEKNEKIIKNNNEKIIKNNNEKNIKIEKNLKSSTPTTTPNGLNRSRNNSNTQYQGQNTTVLRLSQSISPHYSTSTTNSARQNGQNSRNIQNIGIYTATTHLLSRHLTNSSHQSSSSTSINAGRISGGGSVPPGVNNGSSSSCVYGNGSNSGGGANGSCVYGNGSNGGRDRNDQLKLTHSLSSYSSTGHPSTTAADHKPHHHRPIHPNLQTLSQHPHPIQSNVQTIFTKTAISPVEGIHQRYQQQQPQQQYHQNGQNMIRIGQNFVQNQQNEAYYHQHPLFTSVQPTQPYILPPSTQPYLSPPSTQPYLSPPSTQPYLSLPSTQPYLDPGLTGGRYITNPRSGSGSGSHNLHNSSSTSGSGGHHINGQYRPVGGGYNTNGHYSRSGSSDNMMNREQKIDDSSSGSGRNKNNNQIYVDRRNNNENIHQTHHNPIKQIDYGRSLLDKNNIANVIGNPTLGVNKNTIFAALQQKSL